MKANEFLVGKWVKLTQDDDGGDLKAGAVIQLIAKTIELGTEVWTVKNKDQTFFFLGLNTDVEEVKTDETQTVQLPLEKPASLRFNKRREEPASAPVDAPKTE